jgi:hypothetical protein
MLTRSRESLKPERARLCGIIGEFPTDSSTLRMPSTTDEMLASR